MAAIVQVKHAVNVAHTVSPLNFTFDTALTAGNAIVLVILRTNGVANTYSAVDTSDSGALTSHASVSSTSSGDCQVAILSRRNVAGGNTTVSVSFTTGAGGYRVSGFEVSGLDNAALVLSGTQPEEANLSSHFSSSANISGTGFVVAGGSTSANRIYTQSAGFSLGIGGTSDSRMSQYVAGTITNNRGDYTNDGATVSRAVGAMVLLPDVTTRRWLLTR